MVLTRYKRKQKRKKNNNKKNNHERKTLYNFFLHTADIMSGIGDQTIGSLNAYAFNNSEIRIIGEVGSNATANLYDVLGRLVVSHILGDVNYNVISMPSVKKGVYLLNITTKDTTKTIKVMVRN